MSYHNQYTIKVLDHVKVSPPAGSVPTISLPLTFFDIKWLLKPKNLPVRRLYLYEFPYPTHHFMQTVLPFLTHSLSVTLQHFFPFASNLVCPPKPQKPYIHYVNGESSISFTVAEWSNANFNLLIADYPRDVKILHPFVSDLPSENTLEDGTVIVPLMSIQVTVLPNSGLGLCFTYHHVNTDGKGFLHFLKSWSSICRTRGEYMTLLQKDSPFYNREIIKDPDAIELNFLKQWWNMETELKEDGPEGKILTYYDMVRATFVVTETHIRKLKQWLSLKCTEYELRKLKMSTFVVSCALIWVCLVKSKEFLNNNDEDELYHWTFGIDCRKLLQYPIPPTYFGNCLAPCYVPLNKRQLVGENGIFEAAKAIANKVSESKTGALTWFTERASSGKKIDYPNKYAVAGSPQLEGYKVDFGWGRPKKLEAVHIDEVDSIAISDSRDSEGGLEVGVALRRTEMNNFSAILGHHLKTLPGSLSNL
ncbi:Anthocyanin 5-aromatic acyltransferase [Quillaja saponaria]|uniref:Anthocyanin 5-aromatic acyltransferase n=1 Tax=Quillaja saponaria TaxID=32244 RepID=A0AAD7VMW7_QUISA|nr:Anthocyanin 5-aromatic acyltransferase [Quillaja saponaria]